MRIVFMGTPDYSVKTLSALIDAGHELVGVFAQPDKPVGRKQILTPPPTKQFALSKGIEVFQPVTLRDGTALESLKKLAPDVIVVVAYGKILPKEILQLPKFGCVNGHASLLPRHRGASPIQWSIVCGDRETGITTMLMDEGMDTGDILLKETVAISNDDTADSLFERLSFVSAELMLKTLKGLEKGTIVPEKQDESEASYAPILKKEMAHIDYNKTAFEICCLVRGFYSWPCAFTFIEGKRIKVLACREGEKTALPAGTVIAEGSRLSVACGDGKMVVLEKIQPEGSKAMDAAVWLNGHKGASGTVAE